MNFTADVDRCLQVVQAGGIILYPTDTVWGLGCDATNPAAVQRIYQIKQREESKSMIVLLTAERDVIKYVTQPDLRVFDYLDETTKPTTVIYKGAIGMAPNLMAPDGSIAIRIVKDDFCTHLIKRLRKPLVSTSANISGKPAPAFFSTIDPAIIAAADYVVQYRQDDTRAAQPSAVIRWNDDGTVTELRK
ncbi:L-threonylcarbamoyladenylate synthase [Agriterribacter sp.]|uniref:L-threonylcarbamoyladenylate synthase n=1 Tax=Agriterribacter sp. TaxID=2821509 RepID=UPI002BC73A6C|nr:L-threonylcarbamoyladenylate synthase [Agriterribacter sp.]HTN06931.1 L-threonylcarbamoyladenylate synthase [Agriterribacter sp.]